MRIALSSRVRVAFGALALVLVALALVGLLDAALAQGNPFGGPRPPAAAQQAGGFVGWILAKQSEFYRGLSGALRAAKADGSALWGLFGLSFAYGIFHAAGPGHGKAVISSYVVANEETWKRGVALSFASALLQALVAVVLVGVAAALLNATARTMEGTVRWIELVSYGLIALIGARLVWVKGRGFLAALRGSDAAGHHAHHHHDHAHDHHHHGHHDHAHDHGHHHGHDHAHHDHHDHGSAWGHAHGPEPAELAGPGGWRRGLSAIVAVGLRPCSGAILVLVFALAQGLFWAGVVATFIMGLGTAITVAAIAVFAVGAKSLARRFAQARPGAGMIALRGLELAAAFAIFAFGVLLALGYMANERLVGI